jgi:hypothetical protein
MPGEFEKDHRVFLLKGGNIMEKETKNAIWEALGNGHLNICCEVERVKNLFLAFEHAAIYAEEQRNTLHEPPDWSLIFSMLGEVITRIEKEADALVETTMQAAGGMEQHEIEEGCK